MQLLILRKLKKRNIIQQTDYLSNKLSVKTYLT